MAYVDIYPTSEKAQAKLNSHAREIRFTIRRTIKDVWSVPAILL